MALALCLAAAYPAAHALPQGAQIVQGQVALSPGLIQQGSDKAIVNWQSFSIAAGETLRIQQPSVNAVLLNRVVGGDPSLILGQMQANGRVFLVNPRGIVFGRGSQVDAGGLVASTLDLSDTHFLAGSYRFSAGPVAGALQADGSINAPGGTVALVAPQLHVGGSVAARRVGLGAASTVQVDVEGDGLVLFNLRNDDDRDVALKFNGRVQAESSAELRAQARAGAAGQVLNMDGIVQARGFSQQGGRIVIDGGTAGDTLVKGRLDASGDQGGSITVLGQRVGLLDGARLDASGRLGGGDIQVGGGFHGEGTAHNAQRTFVGAGVELRADATEQGDGGRVAIWADQRTDMLGQVWARGGQLGGNGGFVETSGRELLNMPRGGVDVSAPRGRAGQWLLDPYNLTITDTAGGGGDVTGPSPFEPANNSAVLDVTVLNNALAIGNVIVQTGSNGSQAGNISIDGDIHATAATSFSLIAQNAISFTSNGKIRATGTVLDVSLQAASVDTTAGTINTHGGKLDVNATGAVSLGAVTSGDMTVTSSGTVSLSTVQSGKLTIDASGGSGNVSLPSGSLSGALSVTTGGGNITQGATSLTVGGAATLSSGVGNVTLGNLSPTGKLDISTSSGNAALGVVSVGGQLKFASTSGSLGQTSALSVTGGADINTGGTVTLNNASNNLGGTLDISAGATDLRNGGANPLTLGTLNTGTLKVRTGSGLLTLGQGSVASLDAATTTSGNIAQGATSLAVGADAVLSSGAGTITLGNLSSVGKLDLATSSGNVSLAGSVGGQLKFASTSGALSQTGALSVTAGADLSTGGNVTLNNAGNNLGGTLDITAGTTDLRNGGGNDLVLGTLNTGALKARTASGQLTLGQGGVASLDAATTANGNIVQGATSLAVGGVALLSSGAGSVTLGNLSTTGKLDIASSSGNAALGVVSVGGQLKFASTSGALSQTSALSVTGGADINTGGTVTLNNASNNLGGTLDISAGATDLRNGGSNPLTLGTLNTGTLKVRTGSGLLTLGQGSAASLDAATTAGGNIAQGATSLAVGGDAILSSGAGAITLGNLNPTGKLDLSTSSGDVSLAGSVGGQLKFASTSGSLVQTGALSVTAGADLSTGGNVTLNNAGNNLGGSLDITAGTVDLRNGGGNNLTLGTLNTGALKARTASGQLTLGQGSVASLDAATTAGGHIVQGATALAVGGVALLSSGAGSVTLGNLSTTGNLDITSSSGNAVLGAIGVGGQFKFSSTSGSLSQTGALSVTGGADLNTGGNVTLNNGGNNLGGTLDITAGATDLRNGGSNPLTLGTLNTGTLKARTASGQLDLGHGSVASVDAATTAGGNIVQGATLLAVGGDALLSSGTGSVTLGNLSPVGKLDISTTSGDVTLGPGSVGGQLLVSSTSGSLGQTGGLTVNGTTDIHVGGAVNLSAASNVWIGGVQITGQSLDLSSAGNLSITGLTLAANQALSLQAQGNLNLGASVNLDTGSADLTLASGGSFSVLGTLNGKNISLTADTGLSLGHDVTASGWLKLTTNSGGVAQTGGRLSVAGTTTVSAGSSTILLNQPANHFGNAVSLMGADSTLFGNSALTLGTSSTGNLSITTQGAITQTGALTVAGTTTLNAGSAVITLGDPNNDLQGDVTVTGTAVTLTTLHDLRLFSLNQVLPNQALVLDAGGVLYLPSGTGDIDTGTAALTLSSRSGPFATFGTLHGGNVTLRGQSVTLGHDITASGSLDVQSTGGTINQSLGSITVLGASNFNAGGQTITLMGASNDLRSDVTLRGGDTQLTTLHGVGLGLANITGSLVVHSGGAITQTAAGLNVSGNASFSAGGAAITLDESTNNWGGAVGLTGGTAKLRGAGAVALGSVNVNSLELQSNGAVSQSSALVMSGALKVNAGSATIDLSNSGNQLGGTVELTGGTTQLRTLGALSLGAVGINGNLSAQSTGLINQVAGSVSVSGTANFNAGGAAITLANVSNSWGGAVSLTGGVSQLSGNGNLALGSVAVTSLDLKASGNVSQTSALSMSGALKVDAGTGDIDLSHAGNQLGGVVTLKGGVAQVRTSAGLTLGNMAVSQLTVNASGPLNLGQGNVAGNLVAHSGNGAISQTGALHVNGAAAFTSGSGNITLSNSGNQLLGALSLTGNVVTIFNQPSLNFGTLSFNSLDATSNGSIVLGSGTLSGALTAKALGGSITQIAGGLTVAGNATLQASTGITMTQANHLNGSVNLSGGTSSITNAGNLRLGTLSTAGLTLSVTGTLDLGSGAVGGTLTAVSSGAISQSGALSVTGTTNLNAGSAPISLGSAGNSFAGSVDLRGGATVIASGAALNLGSLNVAGLSASSGGGLRLGTGSVGGDLNASGAGITQASGGLSVAGVSTLNAGSANIDLAEAGNAFTGAVSLVGRDATLANGGALHLGSFAVRDLKVSAGGDLDLGGGTASGELTATTRGSKISQSAVMTVNGIANFVADGGQATLVLDQSGNQLLGGITMRGVNGGSFTGANISSALDLSFSGDVKTLTLNSGGVLTLGGGHSTTLTAGAAKGIVLTGPLEVSGLMTLIANGGTAVPVDMASKGAGNDFNRVELKAQGGGSFGRVQLRDGDATRHDGIQVSGDAAQLDITAAGTLDLGGGNYGGLMADTAATGAAIKQSGALIVSGLTTLKAGSGDITLTHPDNQLPSFTIASAGTASLASLGDYTINASSVSTRLELGGAGAISLLGPLSGNGELVMNGSGSLTMTTAQSYSGGTRIESGTVVLQGPAAQAGTGAVQLGAAGQLDLRDGAAMSADLLALGGSVLNSSGSGTLAGALTLQAFTRFLPGAGGLTVSGAISDGGAGFGLGLGGSGTLTLTGSNHYSGVTDISAGTLRANGAGALSSTSAVQLAAGAVLALGTDQTAGSLAGAGRVELGSFTLATGADGRSTSFGGSLVGSGGLTKLGSGRFTLNGDSSHTGTTRVAAGELVLASATALNGVTAVSVDSGATLTVQQSLNLGSLAGAGTVDVQAPLLGVGSNGSSTRWDGNITGSGGLAKLGAGVFTLAGHNTLAGDLAGKAGTLQLEGAVGARPLAAGAAVVPVVPTTAGVDVTGGATLELLTNIDLGALSGSGQVQLNTHTLAVGASGRSSRFDGVMAGSGGLTKAGNGSLTLGGANLFTGSTRVQGGALVLDMAQALAGASALVIEAPGQVQANARQTVASLSGNGALVLNGASLAAGADGADSRFDGAVSGSGGLIKQGAGTLTLTAAHSNSGATAIEAGVVQLSGNGALGSGEIQNQGELRLSRSDALVLDQAISGRGSLVITQGQVTLNSAANNYSGATQVLGGSLITTAAERLSDASSVQVAAGAQLQLGGNETIASLQAAGSVKLAGNLTTKAEQVYTGSLTLASGAGLTLSGTLIDASRSNNQFAGAPLGLSGGQALVTVKDSLQLGDVTLSSGGRIEADRLALNGKLQLSGGSLALVAKAAPDDAKATLLGTAQVPVAGQPLAIAEATVQQGSASTISVAEGARLEVQASGGGSVRLAQDGNSFKGQLSVLSGAGFNTAWVPNAKGAQAVQSEVRVSGQQVMVGGNGIEADLVYIRADQLASAGDAKLVARMPFDEIVLGKALSAPGMTLELAPGAFGTPGSFGSVNGQPIQIQVGSTETGNRTTGPNAGYVAVLPKAGAQGSTAVVLVGPKVGSQPSTGGPAYRFFHDGASQATEIPVVYNGVLPLTPAASGALSSINGDAEDARRARFQETVRTENVTVRLRSGVIAEVGPGRPSTQGSEGAKPPEQCDPASRPVLSCK